MTNYIGIDTGTRLLGWAIIGDSADYRDSGWVDLETPLSRMLKDWDSLSLRLRALGVWATRFFGGIPSSTDRADTIVGIEHPWIGRNRQTALTLGMAWGIIAQAAMQRGFAIVKIEPTQAKKALTGSGRARKEAMLESARLFPPSPLSRAECKGKGRYDEADALGVALATRIWVERERRTV